MEMFLGGKRGRKSSGVVGLGTIVGHSFTQLRLAGQGATGRRVVLLQGPGQWEAPINSTHLMDIYQQLEGPHEERSAEGLGHKAHPQQGF